jgi:acetyl esterase/lipase
MVSFLYNFITKFILSRVITSKQVGEMSREDAINFMLNLREKESKEYPKKFDKKYDVETKIIMDFPCYVINFRKEHKVNRPIVLFLHGSGFMFEGTPFHWRVVEKIINYTDAEVWYIVYPLMPFYTLRDEANVVWETYKEMLKVYKGEQITVIGDSAGGSLASIISYYANEEGLEQPKQSILVSPAPYYSFDKNIRDEMLTLDDISLLVSTSLVDLTSGIMLDRDAKVLGLGDDLSVDKMIELSMTNHDLRVYKYLFVNEDVSYFPPQHVFCGDAEVFYPSVNKLVELFKNQGVDVDYIIGKDMCHAWPYIPLVSESTSDLKKIISYIKN